jgi:hypothetical protein
MQFTVKTLVDITETNARKVDDPYGYRQQQNWMSFLQTASLRVNIYPVSQTVNKEAASQFGSEFKGKHNVWTVTFDIEYEGGLDTEMLVEDFDLVPIITDLDETAKINNNVFRTKDPKYTNIIFVNLDK